VLLILFVATRPPSFHVERSTTIATPPESTFARVNDPHAWVTWSPYEKKDPQMKRTYEGPRTGTGSVYAWDGNNQVGAGRMTIVQSDAPALVVLKLEFFRPFAATNSATFTFTPTAGGTRVTWAMDGPKNFVAKALHLVMNMDTMVGGDFEKGLAALKTLAESAPRASAEAAAAVN
jgi:uncharacterized protein YndB with AHSA1/START domain